MDFAKMLVAMDKLDHFKTAMMEMCSLVMAATIPAIYSLTTPALL